jgi:hypothetical protein
MRTEEGIIVRDLQENETREHTQAELLAIAREIKMMPDGFFNDYESMSGSFSAEQQEKIRRILEPEARRRGLR